MRTTMLNNPLPSVSFGQALRYWLKLGCISFGGPAGQIALMHEELVQRRRWISEARFAHALNYCMLLPGPEAQQLATYIGWLMHGVRGGIAAGVLFVLPSLLLLIGLSWLYIAAGQQPAVAGVLAGVKPAVIAIVLATGWRLASRTLRHPVAWAISLTAFAAMLWGVPFPAVVCAAALAGVAGARWWPGALSGAGGQGPAAAPISAHPERSPERAALIDDNTPAPAHARASVARVARLSLTTVGLGAALWWGLHAWAQWRGVGSTLTDMAQFFTGAALLTFGGAYAVLPYVVQGAVQQYGWLSASQMIDGLALGETTPGPLIMIVAFVGFLGGWSSQTLGLSPLAAGMAGALVATVFTFLPSFLFILAGGPLVERTRNDLRVGAPLAGISCAVVGVMASMALYFAQEVLFPKPSGAFDPVTALIAIACTVALVRYKVGVVKVIGVCAGLGLILRLAGWH